MPSYWSTAHPSLTTLLLAQMPSDWFTAHQSLITFSLGNCHLVGQQLFLVLPTSYWLNRPLIGQQLLLLLSPTDWSTAHQSLTILLSANPPSDWFCVGRVSSSDQAHWSLKGPNRVKVLCAKTTSNQAFL